MWLGRAGKRLWLLGQVVVLSGADDIWGTGAWLCGQLLGCARHAAAAHVPLP